MHVHALPDAVRAGGDNGSVAVYGSEIARPRSIDEGVHRSVRKSILAFPCCAACDPVADGGALNLDAVSRAPSDILRDAVLDRAVPAVAQENPHGRIRGVASPEVKIDGRVIAGAAGARAAS